MNAHNHMSLNAGGRLLSLDVPQVMGILNVTPDSFYAGSRKQAEADIAARANEIVEQGGTIIDIGGQDAKVIALSPSGKMVNFVMNDKCAAGTGRFLDVMARVLEVKVEDLGDLGDKSTKEVGISSTCTVFAESEVISQLAMGTNKCDIIHGIHKSVAGRVSGLCHRIGVRDDVVMTGGVAQNHGIVKALQEQLGHGALGAALFAYQKALKNK